MCLCVFSFLFSEFFLNLYERFRGTYIDMGKCVLEWNHQDNTQVGGSTVLTVKVSIKNAWQSWLLKLLGYSEDFVSGGRMDVFKI